MLKPRGCFLPFADLVVIAKESCPIPFRTRPSKPSAPMVLRLKPRESRSLPVLPRTSADREQNTGIGRSFSDPCAPYSVFRSRQHKYEEPRRRKTAGLFFCIGVLQ